MSRAVVMEGSLEEFDLVSVLLTMSIGRQFTGVELLDECGSIVGTLFLKAGHILSATADNGLSGLDAVRGLMRTRRSRRFCVFRSRPREAGELPVGPVDEVLTRISHVDEERAEGSLLVEGSLKDFDLPSVIESLGLSRACVGIDLFNLRGERAGAVCVKAGQVLFALCGNITGAGALSTLLLAEEGRFVAYRTHLGEGAESLGPVHQFVSEARELKERDATFAASELELDEITETSYTVKRPSPSVQPARPSQVPRATFSSEPVASDSVRPAYAKGRPLLCVTSPTRGAGTTTFALQIGHALAQRGLAITLVDAHGHGVSRALRERRGGKGLYDLLEGTADVEEVVQPLPRTETLRVVSGGTGELLPRHAPGLGDALAEFRTEADLVLVDCPPSSYGLTHAVARAATHALVVVSAERTAPDELAAQRDTLRSLRMADTQLAVVLNRVDYRARPSLAVLAQLCLSEAGECVLPLPIPRRAELGDVLAPTPFVRATFEALTTLLCERLNS